MFMTLASALPVADLYSVEGIAFGALFMFGFLVIALASLWFAVKDKDALLGVASLLSWFAVALAAYPVVTGWVGRASALETSTVSLAFVAERINDAHPGLIAEVDQPGLGRVLSCEAEAGHMVSCEYVLAGDEVVSGSVSLLRVYVAE